MKQINKVLKIGFIGGAINSTIGSTHIKAINLSRNLSIDCAFFSRNKKINISSAKKYNLKLNKLYSSAEQLIKKEKNTLDAVVVLTPPNARYKIIKFLVEYNIPVICEKPLCSDLLTSKKIHKLVQNKKLFFTSTYNYIGYPAIREIKDLINKKFLGDIISFNFEMLQQTYVYSKSKITKWRTKDYSIPTLYLDLCSHLVNISKFLFNEYPHNVMSFSTKNKKFKVIDNVYSWLKFKNNMQGTFWFSKNSLGQRNGLKLRIYGTSSSLEWNHAQPENITIFHKDGKIETLDRLSPKIYSLKKQKYFTYSAGHPNGFLDAFSNVYSDIYDELINYKSSKKINYRYLVDIKENTNIILILDAIKKSSKNNTWIKTKLIK